MVSGENAGSGLAAGSRPAFFGSFAAIVFADTKRCIDPPGQLGASCGQLAFFLLQALFQFSPINGKVLFGGRLGSLLGWPFFVSTDVQIIPHFPSAHTGNSSLIFMVTVMTHWFAIG
jgi:hypothetical protein